MPKLTHKQIMNSRFKCDDGIWRTVWKYIPVQKKMDEHGRSRIEPAQYIMILPNPKTKKNEHRNIKNVNWFYERVSEEI